MSYKKYDAFRPGNYRQRTLRLPKHDYSWTGAYFVTICAKIHEPIFDVPELHTILTEMWDALPKRFPSITLDEFIVMPDHIHFIVWLDGTAINAPTLGDVVGAYKSLVTNAWLRHVKDRIVEYPGRFWKENYFERCIREKGELEQTREYIRNNPAKLVDLEKWGH